MAVLKEEEGHNTNLNSKPQVNPHDRTGGESEKLFVSPLPFNMQVKSNIGISVFGLLKKHFPKSFELPKVFNRNIIKLSYISTGN